MILFVVRFGRFSEAEAAAAKAAPNNAKGESSQEKQNEA
jgi:hypothetical protein